MGQPVLRFLVLEQTLAIEWTDRRHGAESPNLLVQGAPEADRRVERGSRAEPGPQFPDDTKFAQRGDDLDGEVVVRGVEDLLDDRTGIRVLVQPGRHPTGHR